MFCKFLIFLTLSQIALSKISFTCQKKYLIPPNTGESYKGSISGIETGSVKITKQQAMKSHIFSVTLNKPIQNPTVALAIQDISSFNPKSAMNFEVGVVAKKSTKFDGNVDVQGNWQIIQLSYVVSNRADFIADSFAADINSLSPTKNQPQTTVPLTHTLNFGKLSLQRWIIIPFVTGLQTNQQNSMVKIIRPNFNPQTNLLTISVQLEKEINYLQISFVMFHNRGELEVMTLYDMNNIPPHSDTFHGITQIEGQFGKHGVIIETSASFDSPYVESGSQSSQVEYICISKALCKLQGGNMKYQEVGVFDIVPKCILCSSNAHFVASSAKCECISGYRLTKNGCTRSNLSGGN